MTVADTYDHYCIYQLSYFTIHAGIPFYGVLYFSLQNFFARSRQQPESNNASEEVTGSSQEVASGVTYQNLTGEGNPVPGFSSGIVRYARDYMNTRPVLNSWYNRLRLIRPLAIDWLRNSWGNVDEFGRHVYDAMKRVCHIFVPYDRLDNVTQDDLDSRDGIRRNSNAYNTMERPPTVMLPNQSESSSMTEMFDQ